MNNRQIWYHLKKMKGQFYFSGRGKLIRTVEGDRCPIEALANVEKDKIPAALKILGRETTEDGRTSLLGYILFAADNLNHRKEDRQVRKKLCEILDLKEK